MKIICDNCGAKYSIADEKVKGKVFKIRCKKCQESIVVRGDSQENAEVAEHSGLSDGGDVETKVFDYSGYKGNEPVWYVAVEGGEQQGPYTTDQMREYLLAGNIAPESYVWREGLEDWKMASQVAEIANARPVAAAASPAAAVTASGGGLFDSEPNSGGGLFDTSADVGGGLFDAAPAASTGAGLFDTGAVAGSPGDVFSSAPDTSTGGLFSADQNAAAATKDGGGLFDGPIASGSGGDLFAATGSDDDGGGIFASTEAPSSSPRVSAAQATMTGQRNENSVLFSLSNLQALASDSTDSSSKGPSPSPFGGPMSGMAAPGGEASGLIDIRAMASSLSAEAAKADDVDEMLSFGGGGFASTLGAPVLTAAKPAGMSMGMKIGIGAGVVGVLIAVVIAIVLVVQKDTSAQDEKIALLMQQIEAMKAQGASADDINKAKEELEKTKEQKKAIQSGDVVAMNDNKGAESNKANPPSASNSTTSKTVASNTSRKKSSSSGAPENAPAKKEPSSSLLENEPDAGAAAAPRKKTTSALDDLLGPGGGAKKKAPAGGGGGDAKLTRQQVMAGMGAVSGSVKRCGAGKTGTFKVKAKIDPSGRVSEAQEVGDFAGTPAGTCAANAVKRARFPQSAAATNVTFPFKI